METTPFDIEIPKDWMIAVTKEMERVFNISGSKTKQYLQSHLQEQYDSLENKVGAVSLNIPTIEDFKEFVHNKEML